ncbi:8956_t:CDS:1, partial [Ambispora leptoticha]
IDVDDTRDNNTSNTSPKGVTTQLADVTNNLSGHEILRQSARQSLEAYTEKMVQQMSKGKRKLTGYEINDLVRVAIPKIDRFSIDRPTLPCKILDKTENNKYQLGSKFGIIEVLYFASELEPLGTTSFPELDIIPSNKISIREAGRLQSMGPSCAICSCKSDCSNNRCRCKKSGGKCGSRCHGGRSCQNKE